MSVSVDTARAAGVCHQRHATSSREDSSARANSSASDGAPSGERTYGNPLRVDRTQIAVFKEVHEEVLGRLLQRHHSLCRPAERILREVVADFPDLHVQSEQEQRTQYKKIELPAYADTVATAPSRHHRTRHSSRDDEGDRVLARALPRPRSTPRSHSPKLKKRPLRSTSVRSPP